MSMSLSLYQYYINNDDDDNDFDREEDSVGILGDQSVCNDKSRTNEVSKGLWVVPATP